MTFDITHADEMTSEVKQVRGRRTSTIVLAGLANVAVALAKGAGALTSGSAVMLSEAVHSLADTATEVLLFVAVRRGSRPADSRHPFGHGRETYLWALLGAFATFVGGAGVSIDEGISKLRSSDRPGDLKVAFVVLGSAFVLEGASLWQGTVQLRRNAQRWRLRPMRYLRITTDTTLKAIAFEDAAALLGLSLAAAGLLLSHLSGSETYDGVASILIGIVLLVAAGVLAQANSGLLIGQSASKTLEAQLRKDLESLPEITRVPLLFTSVLGPEQLIVAAKVEFADDLLAQDVANVADRAEEMFLLRHPGITAVFLDPSSRHALGPDPGREG